ncbi:nitronate monooxygenase [Starkeya sp. ORNL1]|uniref:NAD(P)H-dependent flavin oxidoreductase n=1 Tax=Starkeya sp. ORNL1 TaxID=2709380 RepID=UPI0014637D4B|nr:nitronate monooxygenase [Starkeya sp. ORNL1]QJP17655.1 nitronate monooxygenase [Starkeya sp. ORNL1]
MWPNRRLLDLLSIELPIIQAPMAGATTPAMAIAVANAGGLGSLPAAMLGADQARIEFGIVRQHTSRPINMNFFCHAPPLADTDRYAAWSSRLRPYQVEFGLDPGTPAATSAVAPFGNEQCDLVVELKPEIVSFHFGLPREDLLDRVKATGAKILSSATTVDEGIWLEGKGCDAIIAQGLEAGGHRGMFLTDDIATQIGTLALVPQLVDAVRVPVIAAGGIADGRGIAAALALGAAAVQIGTAYLFCPEAKVLPLHREALTTAVNTPTAITNILTGRPARAIVNRAIRELGPMAEGVPAFPLAAGALAALRSRAEASGSSDFTPLWSGQGAPLGRALPASELTALLAREALERLARIQHDGE